MQREAERVQRGAVRVQRGAERVQRGAEQIERDAGEVGEGREGRWAWWAARRRDAHVQRWGSKASPRDAEHRPAGDGSARGATVFRPFAATSALKRPKPRSQGPTARHLRDDTPSVMRDEPSVTPYEPSVMRDESSVTSYERFVTPYERLVTRYEPSVTHDESSVTPYGRRVIAHKPFITARRRLHLALE